MSLYDGLGVETAPVPELMQISQPDEEKEDTGWAENLKLMATHLNVHRGEKTQRTRPKPRPAKQISLATGGGVAASTVQVRV